VDEVKGGAGDDVISGIIGSSGTYAGGDNILGGAGTDLLKLLDDDATAAGVVSLEGVEQVNVRMLSAATTQIDASDWVGVATLSNYSSTADSTLSVSGLTIATDISVYDESNVSIDFADIATGSDTATVILNSVGSGTTTTVTVVAGGTASVNLDATGADTLAAANLTVNGTNFLRLEGGDGLRTVTLTGTGNLHLTTDDLITSLDASALTGTNRFTLSGRSDVSVVGGAGKDTFAFGTSLSSYDTVDGGAGDADALTATLGNSVVRLNATNLETATITLGEAAGGGLDLSAAQSVTTLTVAASADGNVGTIANFVGGTANLAGNNIGDISIDTVSAGTLAVVLGSASGVVSIASAAVTDASSLTISTTGSGTQAITTVFDVDYDVKTLAIVTNGSAHLSVADINASGANSVTITTNGSASATFTDFDLGTGIQTFTINAGGSNGGDVNFAAALFDGTSAYPTNVVVNADAGADVGLAGEVQLGTIAAASGGIRVTTLTLNAAGNGSIIGSSASARSESTLGIDLNIDGASATVNLIAGASATIQVGTADLGDISSVGTGMSAGNASLNISASIAQDALVSIASISADDADINFGAITIGSSGGLVIGSAAAGITMTTATASFGTITLGTMATATIGAIALAGSGGKVTGLSFVGATAAGVTVGTLGGSGVGAITLNLGQSATATFADITATTVGDINVTLAEQATATFDDLEVTGAAATIGTITVSVASGAEFTMGSAGSAGAAAAFASIAGYNVTVANSGSADFGNISTTGAGRIGDITLNVSGGGDVDFGTIAASAVGTITVSGSGSITFSTVTATTLAGIDLRNQGSGGDFKISLVGVTNGVVVDGGRGTTTITSSIGNDEFYLKTGLGTDTINYSTTAQGTDSIYRFEAGTADDKIVIYASANAIAMLVAGSGDQFLDGGSAAISFTTIAGTGAAATAMDAADNILLVTGRNFTAIADVLAYVSDSASGEVSFASGVSANGVVLIAWTDTNNDGHISLLTVSAGDTTIQGTTAYDLAVLTNVTAGALVASNLSILMDS